MIIGNIRAKHLIQLAYCVNQINADSAQTRTSFVVVSHNLVWVPAAKFTSKLF